MKQLLLITILLTSVFVPLLFSVNAASWESVGLEEEYIKTILPIPAGGGRYNLFAGTTTGLRWREFDQWSNAQIGLPVLDLLLTENSTAIVIAGNNSDSDGVYLGTILPTGGLGTIWSFTLSSRCSNPTALAYKLLDGQCPGKLFVGNVSNVYTGLHCGDSITSFDTLPAPLKPFGNYCSSLLVNPEKGLLYAGGYNPVNLSGQSGTFAPPDTAYLLSGTTDLNILKKSNTSAMTMIYSRNEQYLAVATLDSGVQLLKDGAVAGTIPAPDAGKPILLMIPFSTVEIPEGTRHTILAVATETDVYLQCRPNEDCFWRKLDDLSAAPTCLAQADGTILWVGTRAGIYKTEMSTRAINAIRNHSVIPARTLSVRYTNGILRFNDLPSQTTTLTIFNAAGRCISRCNIVDSKNTVTGNWAEGLYLYRMQCGNRVTGSGTFVIY